MTHGEVQSLLGAYALDAVDPGEAAVIEEHLAECPRCRAEISGYRDTAALLGNLGGDAPPDVWDRLASELAFERSQVERAPSPMKAPKVLQFRQRSQTSLPVIAAMVAAAAVIIGLLGVSTIRLQHRVDNLRNAVSAGGLQQAAAAAALDPNHTTVLLASADGRLNAQVVIQPDGNAYWVRSDLPRIDARHTYQVWGLSNGQIVSLGLLGSAPRLVAFRVEPGVSRLMVTAEQQGGRTAPSTAALIQGERPT